MPRYSICLVAALLALAQSGCGEEADGAPATEAELQLRRAEGAGGAVVTGARARLSLAGGSCLDVAGCVTPEVQGAIAVRFTGDAAAELVGDPSLASGAGVIEVLGRSAGSVTVHVSADTQLGVRDASFALDFVDAAALEIVPGCASDLGGQEALEGRLASGFAMAIGTSMPVSVRVRDAGGTLLTGFGLQALTASEGLTVEPSSEEGAPATLTTSALGDGVLAPAVGEGELLEVHTYAFDEVNGFLFVTQLDEEEARFTGDRIAPVGGVVRVEALPLVRTDLACTLPFDVKFSVRTPDVCALDAEEPVVAARWVAVRMEAVGSCVVHAALTNANGRGFERDLDLEVQ